MLSRAVLLLLMAIALGGCGDERLARREATLQAGLLELRAIESDPGRARQEMARLAKADAYTVTLLAEASPTLERSAREVGLAVVERLPARPAALLLSEVTGVRLQREGSVATVLSALDKLDVPHGAWIDDIRCTTAGCSVSVSFFARLSDPAPGPAAPELPRPWWPPDRRRWERIQELEADRMALAASLGELGGLKLRQTRHVKSLEIMHRIEPDAFRAGRILAIAETAVEAGVRAFEVRRSPEHPDAVVLFAPTPPKGLADALREVGKFTAREGRYTFRD
jgi:hypothetical protein